MLTEGGARLEVGTTRKAAGSEEESEVHRSDVMKDELIRQSKRGVGKGRGGGGGGVVRLSDGPCLTCLHCVLPDSWVNLCFVVSPSEFCMSILYGERIWLPDLCGSEMREIESVEIAEGSSAPVSVGSLFPLRHWGPPPPRYRGRSRRLQQRSVLKRQAWLWGAKLIRTLNQWYSPDGGYSHGGRSRRRRRPAPLRRPQLEIMERLRSRVFLLCRSFSSDKEETVGVEPDFYHGSGRVAERVIPLSVDNVAIPGEGNRKVSLLELLPPSIGASLESEVRLEESEPSQVHLRL